MNARSHNLWWRRIAAVLAVPALGVCGVACDEDSSAPDSATDAAATTTQSSEPATEESATSTVDTATSTAEAAPTTTPDVVSIVVEQTTRSGDLAVSVFGTDQGLPQNDLDAVVIAPDGVVWAGVDLDEGWSWARLDDGRFVTVGVSPAWGSQFAAGPGGELWMFGPWGFGSPGVQHFDGTDWSFDPETGIPFGVVDAEGILYGFDVATGIVDSLDSAAMPFASFDGVSWTRLSTPPRPVNASAANPAVAPDGTVWVRLDRGLAWFDGEVWSSTVDLDPVAAEAFLHVRAGEFSLGVDGTARMLYDDDEFGPAWLHLADGVVERRAIDVADLAFDDECTVDEAIGRLPLSTDPSIAINDLSQLVAGFAGDTSGQLWTATSCLGVTRTDPVAGEASVFTTQDGLPSLGFRDIAAHPDGSVWVVSDSGLVRLAPIS